MKKLELRINLSYFDISIISPIVHNIIKFSIDIPLRVKDRAYVKALKYCNYEKNYGI